MLFHTAMANYRLDRTIIFLRPYKLKKLIAFALILVSVLSLAACSNTNNSGKKANDKLYNEYISFTTIYMVSYDEVKDYAEYGAAVYEYDFQSKEAAEIFSFPLNAQYALGVYDKKTNSVYYSKEKGNDTYARRRTGDQIYAYDLTTGSNTMLTEDLLAINFIDPVDGFVFFVAARQSNIDCLVLGKIDLSNGRIKYWNGTDTDSINTMSIDKINKRIYVSVYDSLERDIAADTANKTNNPLVHPKYTIYSYDYNLSDKHEILSKDHMEIASVYVRDNHLLYRADSNSALQPGIITISEVSEVIDLLIWK